VLSTAGMSREAASNQRAALTGAWRMVSFPASVSTATAARSPGSADRSTCDARAEAGLPRASSAAAARLWAPSRQPAPAAW
jgi:hypothetical protein